MTVPTRESIDKATRRRIQLHLKDFMRTRGHTPASIARKTKIDKGALSRFLADDGDVPLGLDNFIRLVLLLELDANELLRKPHPREKAYFRPGPQA